MSVHQAISQHSRNQHQHLEQFKKLDQQREFAIEQAVSLCRSGQPFTVDLINQITAQINALSRVGVSPVRKQVSEQMVRDYVNASKKQQ